MPGCRRRGRTSSVGGGLAKGMTMTNRTVLYGIGVSAGTASGPLAVVRPAVGVDDSEPAAVEGDSERVKAALQEVAESLKQRAEHANSATSKQVLEATATLATDRGLIRGIEKLSLIHI